MVTYDAVERFDHALLLLAALWLATKIVTYGELWRLGRKTPGHQRSTISRAAGVLFVSLALANVPLCILFALRFLSGPETPIEPPWVAALLRLWFVAGLAWNFVAEVRLIRVTRRWIAQGRAV